MNQTVMSESDRRVFRQAVDYATDWSKHHQWEIGAAEMALGAAAIAWGVQNGAIEMGRNVVASAFSHGNLGEKIGAGLGGGVGAVAAGVLGSIGLAAGGTAIGIPALILIGGGSFVLSAVGYTAGDLIHKFLHPAADMAQFLGAASVMAVGLALLIDGTRRVIKDQRVLAAASRVKDGIIYLSNLTVQVVANSAEEFKALMKTLASRPETAGDAAGSVVTATAAATGGAVIGTSVAAASVTVLGSHALGGVALALGLASAPLWPAIACGAGGLAAGYATWKACRFFGCKVAARRVKVS